MFDLLHVDGLGEMPVHACIVGALGIFGKCRVAHGKVAAIGLHVDVIALLARRVRRVEKVLGSFGSIGDVRHEVDFPRLMLGNELGERSQDVLVFPTLGVVGNVL